MLSWVCCVRVRYRAVRLIGRFWFGLKDAPAVGLVAAQGGQEDEPRVALDALPLAGDLEEKPEAEGAPACVYV